MHASNLWKLLPVTALALCLQAPVAMAGATNSGDNTTATPGENSSTTGTPADAGHDRRKGTTKTDDMKSSKGHKSGKHHNMEKNSTSGSESTTSGSSSGQ
jgi:hypothetical protein